MWWRRPAWVVLVAGGDEPGTGYRVVLVPHCSSLRQWAVTRTPLRSVVAQTAQPSVDPKPRHTHGLRYVTPGVWIMGFGGRDPLKICRMGQSIFWPTPPKHVTFFHSKLAGYSAVDLGSTRVDCLSSRFVTSCPQRSDADLFIYLGRSAAARS